MIESKCTLLPFLSNIFDVSFELKPESEREAIRLQRERQLAKEEEDRLARVSRRKENHQKMAGGQKQKKEHILEEKMRGETRKNTMQLGDELFQGKNVTDDENELKDDDKWTKMERDAIDRMAKRDEL